MDQHWIRAGLALAALVTVSSCSTRPPAGPAAGDTWIRPQDGMVMVYVPGGTFPMGNPHPGAASGDEAPVHQVTLDAYWIDKTEVSNAEYRACVEAGVCRPARYWDEPVYARFGGDDLPVVGVSWDDAVAYCSWTGGRLPTEAEWEYAAAGPEGRRFPWGDEPPTCDRAQFALCEGEVLPVGSLPNGASWVGALDLSGNVSEWVADYYWPYSADPQTNPTGPEHGTSRVIRGGLWFRMEFQITTHGRFNYWPDGRSITVSFRCAGW